MILAYRCLGIGRAVVWHASTDLERADIHRTFGMGVQCHVAMNLRKDLGSPRPLARNNLEAIGHIRAVFLSRITPMKNLDGLLRALSTVKAHVDLTIAGPIDDAEYWNKCEALIEALPSTTQVRVHGPVAPGRVVDFLRDFDLFILPTHGENFGHAILEALAAGLPVIVGTETPWKQVEVEHAGWLVDSGSPTELAQLIDRFGNLTRAERGSMSESAARVANKVLEDGASTDAYRKMFQELVHATSRT